MTNFLLRGLLFVVLLALTWSVRVYHIAALVPPEVEIPKSLDQVGRFVSKEKAGIHQLVLQGKPFERGVMGGKLTQSLLYRQEKLLSQFFGNLVSPTLHRFVSLGMMRWFWGLDSYIEPSMLKEMYGISLSTSHEFDGFANRYPRQIAYHGIHEVGQMMVDRSDIFGCTIFLAPHKGSWLVGRTFDFELGRIFDEEKVLKWIFPDSGFAFLSVSWAGMVGVVTGVNEKGVFISINAAGSEDFGRYGTPSTLTILKALQESETAEQAVKIIREAQFFITDIIVVSDTSGKAFRIEKSPKKTYVLPVNRPTTVSNHLVHADWANDKFNRNRKETMTTLARETRGEVLLSEMGEANVSKMLGVLRDRKSPDGEALVLGNRQAIDGLVASHAVIYDPEKKHIYVGKGPGISGAFLGYDLEATFQKRHPVRVASLPRDPHVSDKEFYRIFEGKESIKRAKQLLKRKRCKQAKAELIKIEHPAFYGILGDIHSCLGQRAAAKQAYTKAVSLKPAYLKRRREWEAKAQ